jgi:hypothetical protein
MLKKLFILLKPSTLLKAVIIIAIFAGGGVAGFYYSQKYALPYQAVAEVEQNSYIAFLSEIYDIIQQNYWNKLEDTQLNKLFILGTEKLTGQQQSTEPKTKAELMMLLTEVIGNYDSDDKRKEFSASLSDIVLANLEPFGRSRLYARKDEQALSNTVQNKNPDINRYDALEVPKEASQSMIENSYKQLAEKWNPKTNSDPQAPQKYAEINEAYKVLKDPESRKVYDISGVEPTMDYKLIRPTIFHMHLSKFSPTTMEELVRVSEKVTQDSVDTLIFDLRGNIGGAIDGLPYFLGPFIGQNQYAYQFMHQGEITDYKTKTGWLPSLYRYKKVVILIDNNSQSTAEVMAATLKKYNVGVLVGVPTKGWGTVEKVFKVNNQIDPSETYSAFLVHTLTLREDGKPIEGNGVEPLINVTDPTWEQQLYSYFNSQEIVDAVKEIFEEN